MTLTLTRDGRKYTICLVALAIATVALFLRLAPFEGWSYFTLGDLALYFGANVAHAKVTGKSVTGKPR